MERVIVAGGGVLGTMQAAAAARRRGYDVVQLEREAGPRGASVRNFGLIWVSGRAAGGELALAVRARKRREDLAAQVPAAGFRPFGSITLATDEAELALLKEAAALPDAGHRGFELLDAAAVREVRPGRPAPVGFRAAAGPAGTAADDADCGLSATSPTRSSSRC